MRTATLALAALLFAVVLLDSLILIAIEKHLALIAHSAALLVIEAPLAPKSPARSRLVPSTCEIEIR